MTLLAGFTSRRVPAGQVALEAAVAGDGPPVVLLHRYPQTHATVWQLRDTQSGRQP